MSEIIHNPETWFERLSHDINTAKTEVLVESYIFETDSIGSKIGHALAAAANNGAKVYLLVDGVGSPFVWPNELDFILKTGVNFRFFRPIPWHFWQWRHIRVRRSMLLTFFHYFLQLNRRNHRKIAIIDNKIIYLGSFNLTSDHLPIALGGNNMHDLGVRLVDQDPQPLIAAFWHAWQVQTPLLQNTANNPKTFLFHPFALNYTRKLRQLYHQELLNYLTQARQRIYMVNAYFLPSRPIFTALTQAAQRGCEVRIILPAQSDIKFFPAVSRTFYKSLLQNNVEIYEYQSKILHAKYMIIDEWGSIGSTNLNHRSYLHDFEVDYAVTNPTECKQLNEIFQMDLHDSKKIDETYYRQFSIYQKLVGWILRNFRYWM